MGDATSTQTNKSKSMFVLATTHTNAYHSSNGFTNVCTYNLDSIQQWIVVEYVKLEV